MTTVIVLADGGDPSAAPEGRWVSALFPQSMLQMTAVRDDS
jgi:hypothetical protein